ncbi:MAG: quinolinate synthase NadA [Parcubacteria group bacterium]|nr:quinolinate synthase NadA [Parcubacteria group bacterium]
MYTELIAERAKKWYELFSRYAEDLYEGRYTREQCRELAEISFQIEGEKRIKRSTIVVHNYLFPEFHEIADKVGDSLGLSFFVNKIQSSRVDFESVYFMGATAKIITGDATRVYVPDYPEVLGCSLVFGTDYKYLKKWKEENPDGIFVTYINSDAYVKSISDFVMTSRNAAHVIAYAVKANPGKKILVLPDKFLGYVMKAKALDMLRNENIKINPQLIEVYTHEKDGWHASCYVHEKIGERALDTISSVITNHPDIELMIHPECGCANSCLMKVQAGIIPQEKAYFLSTEQMVEHARASSVKKFIVATEKGMVYRLRKEVPDKEFYPVSFDAECQYMKSCTLEKLLASLRNDRIEIVLCNDCCDPESPYRDERSIHIQRSIAEKAKKGIERMLSIV